MGSNKPPEGPDRRKPATAPPPTPVRGASETMVVTPDMVVQSAAIAAVKGAAPDPDATMQVTSSMLLAIGAGQTMAITPDMVVNDASNAMAAPLIERVLAVVKLWHVAVTAVDADTLVATCAEDIELVGPRGSTRGHVAIRDWLARAGFSATPTRWFCGGDGHVVVEQQAHWRDRDGVISGVIASAFVVRDGRIVRYERFDELATALTMYGLRSAHEVIAG